MRIHDVFHLRNNFIGGSTTRREMEHQLNGMYTIDHTCGGRGRKTISNIFNTEPHWNGSIENAIEVDRQFRTCESHFPSDACAQWQPVHYNGVQYYRCVDGPARVIDETHIEALFYQIASRFDNVLYRTFQDEGDPDIHYFRTALRRMKCQIGVFKMGGRSEAVQTRLQKAHAVLLVRLWLSMETHDPAHTVTQEWWDYVCCRLGTDELPQFLTRLFIDWLPTQTWLLRDGTPWRLISSMFTPAIHLEPLSHQFGANTYAQTLHPVLQVDGVNVDISDLDGTGCLGLLELKMRDVTPMHLTPYTLARMRRGCVWMTNFGVKLHGNEVAEMANFPVVRFPSTWGDGLHILGSIVLDGNNLDNVTLDLSDSFGTGLKVEGRLLLQNWPTLQYIPSDFCVGARINGGVIIRTCPNLAGTVSLRNLHTLSVELGADVGSLTLGERFGESLFCCDYIRIVGLNQDCDPLSLASTLPVAITHGAVCPPSCYSLERHVIRRTRRDVPRMWCRALIVPAHLWNEESVLTTLQHRWWLVGGQSNYKFWRFEVQVAHRVPPAGTISIKEATGRGHIRHGATVHVQWPPSGEWLNCQITNSDYEHVTVDYGESRLAFANGHVVEVIKQSSDRIRVSEKVSKKTLKQTSPTLSETPHDTLPVVINNSEGACYYLPDWVKRFGTPMWVFVCEQWYHVMYFGYSSDETGVDDNDYVNDEYVEVQHYGSGGLRVVRVSPSVIRVHRNMLP